MLRAAVVHLCVGAAAAMKSRISWSADYKSRSIISLSEYTRAAGSGSGVWRNNP